MYWNSQKIKADHIKKNEKGKADFTCIDSPEHIDLSRFCYWSERVTVKTLTDYVKKFRREMKTDMI